MSYASEICFKHYMIEFKDGGTAHIGAEDVAEVQEYCTKQYSARKIDTIYLEVYYSELE